MGGRRKTAVVEGFNAIAREVPPALCGRLLALDDWRSGPEPNRRSLKMCV
ncbi:hypothetical protein KCP73_06595 [Salmonella enterica subsp. enterica]|nr:hypothetical protein KCP73_06595 [Salmonella enterica subsp. enterica]